MIRRDFKHVLRSVEASKTGQLWVTLGCNGMVITGIHSTWENYIAASAVAIGNSGKPDDVINQVEILETIKANKADQENTYLPPGIEPSDCDDMIVLQEATIQFPNGQTTPVLGYWFGRISAVNFWMFTPNKLPKNEPVGLPLLSLP